MEHHEFVHSRLHKLLVNNFLGGLAWGLGATVGVAIFFAVIGFIGSQIGIVPFIGSFVADVIQFIADKNPSLVK